jgi:hypothetical protein
MKIARVLLANQPRLLRERVLAAIANQPDIEIVGQLEDTCDIPEAVARLRPDWVVVTLEESGALSPQCYDLLEEHPQTKILSISSRRNSATLCWAHSSCTPARWNQRRRICSGRCEANTSLCGPSRLARTCFGRIDLPRSLFPDMSSARQALGVCTPVCATGSSPITATWKFSTEVRSCQKQATDT